MSKNHIIILLMVALVTASMAVGIFIGWMVFG